MDRTFVSYLRVSTDKQGRSGLGLEAQQAAIAAFIRPGDRLLAPPYIEVESGKNSARPELRAALNHCRRTGATLLIARLDRLARKVSFIANLMEEGVPFIACDRPHATAFELHIYASMAQEEGRAISARTKAALAAAKARGKALGGDRGYRPPSPPANPLAAAGARRAADHAAHRAAAAIEEVRAMIGAEASLQALARELNERQIKTPRDMARESAKRSLPSRGGSWTATAVKRVLARTTGNR